MSTILAIESSCDETSAAILHNGNIMSNIIATQEVHAKYGGVVPELASRAHQQNIVPVISQALKEANIDKKTLDAIAFTRGPGLLGALLVGTSFAKSFAMGLDIPLVEVNHMEAHILAHFIENPKPNFPFLCLTVSGGHTQLVIVKDYLDMDVIGETIDDAVGEAFDKTAKIMGLPYPGGPMIDKYAQQGNPLKFKFKISKMEDFKFSFSGIKTAFLYFLRAEIKEDENFIKNNLNDICASVQYTLIETLMVKVRKAMQEYDLTQVAIAGGVSANSELRKTIQEEAKKRNWEVYIPDFEYCTDNAAMIAIAGYHKYKAGYTVSYDISPNPRMKING